MSTALSVSKMDSMFVYAHVLVWAYLRQGRWAPEEAGSGAEPSDLIHSQPVFGGTMQC